MSEFRTLSDLVSWLKGAPIGTRLDAHAVAGLLGDLASEEPPGGPELTVEPVGGWTWAERLWVVPAERRLGTKEVQEALQRGKSWLFDHMDEARGSDRIPHRKLDGQVTFTAGELRAWIRDQEETIHGGRMESTPAERRLHVG